LKRAAKPPATRGGDIAPITGARIETGGPCGQRLHADCIAPITGARIETLRRVAKGGHPMIAPITGARIETIRSVNSLRLYPYRPHHGGAD